MHSDDLDPTQASNEPQDQHAESGPGMDRRKFLQGGAVAGVAAMLPWSEGSAQQAAAAASRRDDFDFAGPDRDLAGASITELQARMRSGRLSSVELVSLYLRRIRTLDQGLDLRSV